MSEPSRDPNSKRDIQKYEYGDLKEQNLIFQENKHLLQNNFIVPIKQISQQSSASNLNNITSCNITSSNSINV